MLIIQAPAKLNLTLEVLGKRTDGFHEIRSVIQTIGLADSISFQESNNIEFESDSPGWDSGQSLVSKTVDLIRQSTGCSKGVTIKVDKQIPLLSGLGGDSSNAAAVLRGLNQLWTLGLSRQKLAELAWQLGSDVAFFLYGGTAMIEGRGEIVTPLPPLPRRWVVLVIPSIPRESGKTKQLYDSLKPLHYTDGQITQKLADALKEGSAFTPSFLFNTFENVAFSRFSELDVYRQHIIKVGADNVHLAGSGPTLFSIVEDKAEADDLSLRLKQQGLETYIAETLPAVEDIV